jgi:peptidase M28-like protein/PDZ domain-containing protein
MNPIGTYKNSRSLPVQIDSDMKHSNHRSYITMHVFTRRLVTLFALCISLAPQITTAGETEAMEKRLLDAVSYLASDEMEGRAPGTKGLDLAAEFIRQQFEQIGLNTALVDGAAYQPFEIQDRGKVDNNTKLSFITPASDGTEPQPTALKLNEDFTPLGGTGSDPFKLPLVFAGYGITAEKEGYDDYAGLDVKGKAVILLRHEPQQENTESPFNGDKDSKYAPFRAKLANARKHGAACILFCTDEHDLRKNLQQPWLQWKKALAEFAAEQTKLKAEQLPALGEIDGQNARIGELLDRVAKLRGELNARLDPLLPFGTAGLRGDDSGIPVLQCRRDVVDRLLAAAGQPDLATLEQKIDAEMKPASLEITGWQVAGQVAVRRDKHPAKNVVALLEGKGPRADEVIVVGAHYDHVGVQENRNGETEVYNGADDNASGVSAMLEIARQLAEAEEPPERDVLFVAFSGEERGLLGSRHYVEHPLLPLKDTVAMVNLDMVGRLRSDTLTIYGTGTATGFDELVERLANEHGMTLKKKPNGTGPSDHASFYRKDIPVLFFITGMHQDLHKTTDDVEKINVTGMRRVSEMVLDAVEEIAESDTRPEFQKVVDKKSPPKGYLGVMPAEQPDAQGVVLQEVLKDSPAEKAGLKSRDVVLKIGDTKIPHVPDLLKALRDRKPGDKIQVTIQRETEEIVLEVVLGSQ